MCCLQYFRFASDLKEPESVNPIEDDAVETLIDHAVYVGLWVASDDLLPAHVPKVDVMAIGVMLYEILTGVLPFDDVPWDFAGREQGGDVERLSLSYFLSYPPPKDLNPNTPDALAEIVYHCLVVSEYGLDELEQDLVDFLRKE